MAEDSTAEELFPYADLTVDELQEDFKYIPEIQSLLTKLVAALAQVDATTVDCKFCHATVPVKTAHAHEGGFVGDACCWDERLRTTE
jgi:hypothetical protein